jgi:hypothetical protein
MDDRENEYLRTPTEVADALGLPLLGALAAEPRFHQLAESLTSLSPDPRFSGRLYRFIDAEAPLIWVAGLGDAGEELPVAIGLAEMAAATGAAPALLACTRESLPPGGGGRRGRPIFSHRFADAVAALYPSGCVAGSSGLQGVYRAWPFGAPEDAPLEPASMIVAGPVSEGVPPLPASSVTNVILVVPYRDQPIRRLLEAAEMIRAGGYTITGCVAYGPEAGAGGMAPVPENVPVAREPLPSEPPAPVAAFEPPAPLPIEPVAVPVRQTWSAAFGPRQTRGVPSWLRRGLLVAGLAVGVAVIAFGGMTLWRMLSGTGPGRSPKYSTTALQTPSAGEAAVQEPASPIGIEEVTTSPAAAEPAITTPPAVAEPVTEPPAARASAPVVEASPPSPPPAAAETLRAEAPVTVRPPEPPAPTPDATEELLHDMVSSRSGPYAVQCGAYQSEATARREAQLLTAAGIPARALHVRIPERGAWWRVLAGEFTDVEAAAALARRLLSEGRVREAHPVGAGGLGQSVEVPAGNAPR